jgi:hypothetical protein
MRCSHPTPHPYPYVPTHPLPMPAQVFDVSRSTPKQLSVGRFEDPKTGASLGDVRSLRCNCDGTRVSLLASKRISERSRYVCM